MVKKSLLAAALIFSAAVLSAGKLEFSCSVNKKDAIFKAGDKIVFTVSLKEEGKTAAGKKIRYYLFHDHRVVKRGDIPADKKLTLETSSKKTGWVYVQTWVVDKQNKLIRQTDKRGVSRVFTGGIGAMVEPEKLRPPMQEPADFDAFWNSVKKELAAVPMKVLEKKQLPDKRVNVYDIKISCAGKKPVSGYLCVPRNAKPGSCPVYVSFHGAGVCSAGKNIGMAMRGLIALDINAHGIANGKPKEFYEDLRKNYYYTTRNKFCQKRYAHWNKHDRSKFYFKGMYMLLMSALEYVKSLPEWDGKHLIVVGGSQGGAQVLAACALDKDITFARAGVPAMCDHSGTLGGRRSGWPALYSAADHAKNPAYAKCAAYFDGAYFAKRVRCPIYINTGFMDGVCPPSSVFAAYNNIPAGVEKHMQTCPTGRHDTPHTEGGKALNAYIKAITKK